MLNSSFRHEAKNLCVNLVVAPIFRKDPSQFTLSLSKGFGVTSSQPNASDTENYGMVQKVTKLD